MSGVGAMFCGLVDFTKNLGCWICFVFACCSN